MEGTLAGLAEMVLDVAMQRRTDLIKYCVFLGGVGAKRRWKWKPTAHK